MSWYDYTPLGAAYNLAKKLPIVGGVLSGPQSASTAASQQAVTNANRTQQVFQDQGKTSPYSQGQLRGVLGQQQQNVGLEGQNIAGLQAIASGQAPSAAQIQLQNQGAANAAGQFGSAAALQGRNPGLALQMATTGAVNTQAQTNAQAAQQRAADMATAQGQLTGAIQGQGATLGNMQGQGIGAQQNYAQNQLGALNAGVNASTGLQQANTANAASNNAYYGGLLSGAAGAATAATIKSDRTAKTDVEHADLDKLASALQAFAFKYKPGEGPAGERVGVMAQDVLKGGPVGRGMVDRGGDGKLQLDGSNAVGAALAMSAEALKRTKRKAA